MKKREAAFTTKYLPWIRKNLPTCAFEVKHTRGKDTFIMSELREHQRDALLAVVSDTGMSFKIPDTGMSYNPFDGFYMKKVKGYVIISYPTAFVVLNIKDILKVTTPSLSYKAACSIATHVVEY